MKRGVAALLAAGLALPLLARATAGEWEASAGVAMGARNGALAGVEAGVSRHLSDFWSCGVSVRDLRVLGDLGQGHTAALADVRFVLDALRWVPAVTVSIGGVIDARPDARSSAAVRAEFSLGYRVARSWGVAGFAAVQQPWSLDGVGTAYGSGGVRWQWFTGGPDAPDL